MTSPRRLKFHPPLGPCIDANVCHTKNLCLSTSLLSLNLFHTSTSLDIAFSIAMERFKAARMGP